MDNCAPDRCQEVVPFSEVPVLPDGQLPSISIVGRNLKAHGVSQLNIIPSNSRGVLPTMRRRVQSPVCVRNPFLEDKNSQCTIWHYPCRSTLTYMLVNLCSNEQSWNHLNKTLLLC